jgi:hypothetical protein
MSLPHNYLLCAPSDATNAMGTMMSAADLIKGLRQCNANLFSPEPKGNWDARCLWLGHPRANKKICAFPAGPIPEFTQVGPGGYIELRGWRSILSRAIATRAVRRADVERVFKISMDLTSPEKICQQCLKEGLGNHPSNGKSGLCDTHDKLMNDEITRQRTKKDAPWAVADIARHSSRQPVSVSVRGKR